MSCPNYCCQCCCNKEEDTKYPHLLYKLPVEKPQAPEIPISKIFHFPQQRTEFVLHPQLTDEAITVQPTGTQGGTSSFTFEKALPLIRVTQYADPTTASGHDSSSTLSSSLSTPSRTDSSTESIESISPTLIFSTYYDFQRSLLRVHIDRAENLTAGLKESTRKTFIVMYLDPNKEEVFQSKVVCSTLSPNFQQVFDFTKMMSDEVRRQKLVFRLYDSTKSSKGNFIGSVVVPLGEADLFGVITSKTIDRSGKGLRGQTKGDLLLSLTYNPRSKKLKGIVLKATNLQKQDMVGLADPYVKVYLLHQGRRQSKWKTTVKKNTLTPVFNETFSFDITNMEIKDISLEILVMDYDRITPNELVGRFAIGDNVCQESGQSHWNEVISSPQQAISHWHSILSLPANGSKGKRGSLK